VNVTLLKPPPAALANLAPDRFTEPFWRAAREGVLVCPQCVNCGTFRFPPSCLCGVCQTDVVNWVELSGAATLFTYTVVYHPTAPSLVDAVPYAICVVELDGAPGVRMISNLVDCDADDLVVGQALQVVWDRSVDGVTIPRFHPAAA
jgi:uncharacterized protein